MIGLPHALADTEFFKAEGRPDTRAAAAGEQPLGNRVRGVFQPQAKDKDDKGKDEKGKDDKGKDAKAKEPAKPNAPAPLKPEASLSPETK